MSKKAKKHVYNILFFGKYGLTGLSITSKRGWICEPLINQIYNEIGEDTVLMNIVYMGEFHD